MNRSPLRIILYALLLLAVPHLARADLFDNPVTATTCNMTGVWPFGVKVADLNGDGLADIVTSNQIDGTVSVLLGQGGGSFAAHVDYAVGFSPLSLVIADFNGDGHPDVATGNLDGGSYSVLLGRGDGTFNPKFETYIGGGPRCVAAGDLNGDGRMDLVVAQSLFNRVVVFLGFGDGSFYQAGTIATGSNPRWVEINDLNGDGRADLTVSNTDSGTLSVMLGVGDGTFLPKTDYPVLFQPRGLKVADLNGDGRPDIVSTTGSTFVSVLYGTGSGSFGPRSDVYVGLGAGVSLAVGDVNGDGRKDIVTCSLFSGGFSVVLGSFFGGFSSPLFHPGSGFEAREIGLADLNQDGRLDVVTDDYDFSHVRLAFGDGFGGFTDPPLPPAPPSYVIDPGNSFGSFESQDALVAGDVNEDGNPDLANPHLASDNSGNVVRFQVSWLLGAADGSFQPGTRVIDLQTPKKLKEIMARSDIALVDLNGDRHLDILASSSELDAVVVALGRGDGTFGSAATYGTNVDPQRMAIGDFNGDGRADLAVTCASGALSVLLGKGDGTFKGKSSYGAGKNPAVLAIGDVNRDGRPDIVVGNQDFDSKGVLVGSVWLLLGTGNGGFKDRVQLTTGVLSEGIALRDLNGDGRLDLIVEQPGEVSVFLGNGDGTFRTRHDYPTSASPFLGNFVLADLNGDGKLDVAMPTSSCSFGTVDAILGNGDGSFGPSTSYFAGMSAGAITSADFNHDGRNDLAVVVSQIGIPDKVAILLNRGGGASAASPVAASGSNGSADTPATFAARVSPLPLHGEGTLHFTLTRPGAVRIGLYDLSGRKVRRLVDQPWMAAGAQQIRLDGRDESGGTLSPGLYFYRIDSSEGTLKGQFILMR